MKTIKFILFIEALAMFVTGAVHLFSYIFGEKFPLSMYPIMFVIILLCCLLVIFVITPFANWWFDL